MAYVEHEWVTGETITAAKMNNIEEGIAEAAQSGGGGYDIVVEIDTEITSNPSNYNVTWDYPAVRAKVLAGELVTGIAYLHYNYDVDVDGDTSIEPIPMYLLGIYSDGGGMVFRQATVTGSNNTTSATFFVRNFRLVFDVSTGVITEVSDIIRKEVYLS